MKLKKLTDQLFNILNYIGKDKYDLLVKKSRVRTAVALILLSQPLTVISPQTAIANQPYANYMSKSYPKVQSLVLDGFTATGTAYKQSDINFSYNIVLSVKYVDNPIKQIHLGIGFDYLETVASNRQANCQPVGISTSSFDNPSPINEFKLADGATIQNFVLPIQFSGPDTGRDWCNYPIAVSDVGIYDIGGGGFYASGNHNPQTKASQPYTVATVLPLGINNPLCISGLSNLSSCGQNFDLASLSFVPNRTLAQKLIDSAADKAAADKAARSKKTSILCIKGKSTKKVIGIKPKCPREFKVVKK